MSRKLRRRLSVTLCYLTAIFAPLQSCLGKDVFVQQGQRQTIASVSCYDALYCHYAPCIEIKKSDGSAGRAHLYSDWLPGRSHDLDVQEGEYCDKLDLYFGMAYSLDAIPETNVTFVVPNDMYNP
jgi:hypothetical protein